MILLSGDEDGGERSKLLERLGEMRVLMVAEGGMDREEVGLESVEDLLDRLGGLAR